MARSGWGTVRPSCLGLVSVVGSCELTSSPVAERTEMPRTETRSPFIAPEIAVPEPSDAGAGDAGGVGRAPLATPPLVEHAGADRDGHASHGPKRL